MDFSAIFDANASDREPIDGEIVKDGIIYCARCGTPRETVITNPFTGKEQKVRCICKCEQEKNERERAEDEAQARARSLRRVRAECFGDLEYSGCTFDADDGKDPQNSRRMRNYVSNFERFKAEGQGLILFGDTGTGKSFHSACVANALMGRGYSVVMVSVPTLVASVQRNAYGKVDPMAEAIKADLLILDDLGAERGTSYAQEQVYAAVDGRYSRKRPMIISTNLDAHEMSGATDVMSRRIYGRIMERCFPMRYSGPDRRPRKMNRAEVASILDS